MVRSTTQHEAEPRVKRIIAKLRNRQLKLAIEGRVEESYQYAHRADRIRQLGDEPAVPLAEAS